MSSTLRLEDRLDATTVNTQYPVTSPGRHWLTGSFQTHRWFSKGKTPLYSLCCHVLPEQLQRSELHNDDPLYIV
jgi:hypothetical protein